MESDVANETTKERLIVTAERLFARHGLAGVTVRQINEAAGQRNTSAIYYHFGCKEKLIEAIFGFRMVGYEIASTRALDALEAEGRSDDARAVLEAMSAPMRKALFSGADWHYLSFVAQVLADPRTMAAPFEGFLATSCVQRGLRHLRRAVPELPDGIFNLRMRSILFLNIMSIADMAKALHRAPPIASEGEIALRYEDLMDTEAAILKGTASPGVLRDIGGLGAPVPTPKAALV